MDEKGDKLGKGRCTSRGRAKPEWLKMTLPGGATYNRVKGLVGAGSLHTVCREARCPNQGECWNAGTATFLILGEVCTRGCRFCAVATGRPGTPPDPEEPERLARAAGEMGLKYVVVTSVDRDDLEDGGAQAFATTITTLHRAIPQVKVEVLTPDFQGSHRDIDLVTAAGPQVFAHNLETVRELTPGVRDRRCSYDRSLEVLRRAREGRPGQITKSGIMLGMGETDEQIGRALEDMREQGVAIVTLGQYLQPTTRHLPVDRWVTPREFQEYGRLARSLGFAYVASSPLVRSSYMAAQAYERACAGP